MSGYTNFAVIGAGNFGNFIIQQLLKDKAAGTVKEIDILTRQGSKTTVQGDAKVIQVDYSKDDSIKQALAGVHVAVDVQTKIAAAAKEVGVQLFCPSEFSENETEGIFAAKAATQEKLKAMGVPYAAFYNGPFSDMAWIPCIS
ncbi:hypothetical protein BGY98DRAFT_1018750 [Russula aff. rugulosa BPL654]|nr:hypothetical protein BGY98DRAFT_1018750 [Russula aff. rugulosa BPL654]